MAERRFAGLLILTLGIAMSACSHEVTVSGKTVEDVFADPQVVKLVKAACDGEVTRVNALIQNGVDVNATGYREMTPLVWAMMCGDYAGVEALLKAGADPNFKMEGDHSASFLLAGGDDPRMLRLALEHGGNPDIWSGDSNALMVALIQSRPKNFQMLLDYGAAVNNHDVVDRSAATTAVTLGQFDKLIVLLDHGYTYDLPDLARGVVNRIVPGNSDAARNKQRVIEMLKARGVRFPLPPIEPPPPPTFPED